MSNFLSKLLRPKVLILLSSSALIIYIIKYLWKYKGAIQTLLEIKSTLSNAKNMLDSNNQMYFPPRSEVLYERISRKFTTWPKLHLPECDHYLSNLRVPSLTPLEKQDLWGSLSLSVFTQLFQNIYSSEIYKMIFLISTHLFGRKEQEGEDCSQMINSIEILNNSLREDFILTVFLKEKLNVELGKIPLKSLIGKEDLKELFMRVKVGVDSVKRIPMPVFEFSIKVFPQSLKSDPNLKDFLVVYCLPEIQYELKKRIDSLYEKVLEDLIEEIEKNGKDDPVKGKVIELPRLIPIIKRKDGFSTWESYETLGRKIYFDLFTYD